MNWIVRSAIQLGFLVWDVSVSAGGCLVFVRGFRTLSMANDVPPGVAFHRIV